MVMRSLRNVFKNIFLTALALLSFASCRKEFAEPDGSEAASLTLSVGLPSISLQTRAREMYSSDDESIGGKIVSDPFATDLEGWTDYEKLIDARELYRLTLLLIDRTSGNLVGYRDLYKGSPDVTDSSADEGANGWWDGAKAIADATYGSQAVVTFNYDHPLHKCADGSSLEALNRGLYRIIALANWGPVTINATDKDGTTYSRKYIGLTDRKGYKIEDYITSILEQFNGIQSTSAALKFSGNDSGYSKYHEFMDFALYSSDKDFLCNIAPQPLFLVCDFELRSGQNNISAQLKRTWARLRISVENISHDELTVDSLAFCEHTTRNQSYLFLESGRDAAALDPDSTKYGSPNILKVSDDESGQYTNPFNALIATVNGTKIPGLPSDNSNDLNSNQQVIFDGYILDGDGDGEPFAYNLGIRYNGKTVKRLKRVKNEDGTWGVNKSDPYTIGDNLLYVIQNQEQQKRILYAGTSQLETMQLANDGSGNFLDRDMYFEPAQVFRFCKVKDENGKDVMEEVTNLYGDKPNEKQSYPLYNIQSYDGLYWIGAPWGSKFASNGAYTKNLPLLPNSATPVSYVLRNDGQRSNHLDMRYLSFYSTVASSDGKRYFINVNGNSSRQNQVDGWTDSDGGSQFYIHRVEEVEEGAFFSGKVTLTTVDPETAVSSPVTAIRRNDFINILISVSYNEKAGEIEFKVKDWNAGGGNIEFN